MLVLLPILFHRPEAACGALRGHRGETQELPYRKRFSDAPAVPIYAEWAYRIQTPAASLDARFLRAIETWCARNGMSAGAFGAAVYRDRGFVASLRDGRSPRLGTVDRALAVMGEPPAGPAFCREVEAFSRSDGGQALAARDEKRQATPPLSHKLLGGRVAEAGDGGKRVRASMKAHASPAEWRENSCPLPARCRQS